VGLVLDRVGLEPGRVERGYIRVERPFSFIFLFSFYLFLFLEREALSSLLPSMKNTVVFFRETDGFRGGERVFGDGSDAAVGRRCRRRHRANFFFFFALTLLLSLLYSFLVLKFPNFSLKCLDLRKERKEIYTFFLSLNSPCNGLIWLASVWYELCCFVCFTDL